MKSLLTLLFILTTYPVNADGKALQCDVSISFGSYGSGTPSKVIKEIDSYLKKNKDKIKSQTTKRWGLEGEFDYCLLLKKESFKDPIFEDLKKIIPLESKNGYTTLKSDDGKVHKTTWPK